MPFKLFSRAGNDLKFQAFSFIGL